MKITFDTENVASHCPMADTGTATLADCQDCFYFVEMDGFDVICSLQEPIQEDGEIPLTTIPFIPNHPYNTEQEEE